MAFSILVLGASYGSLFATKCAMVGHDVTLVCRGPTAELINRDGTEVRIKLKGESAARPIRSTGLAGSVRALPPHQVDPRRYDLAVLAMQEPQYSSFSMRPLMMKLADARVPCLSLMNMPPETFLRRIPGIDTRALRSAFADMWIWERFDPQLMTLCSPDPQAVRPADEGANILQVNLATNFKAAEFALPQHNSMLRTLADDIEQARFEGHHIPVKLRVHPSLFVPMAKWPMLIAGNYRCVTAGDPVTIREAVFNDIELSREIYAFIASLATRLGAKPDDLVPFDKYAAAAEQLTRPSSVARAIASGAPMVERVDKVIQLMAAQFNLSHPALDRIVALVDAGLAVNRARAA